MKSLILNRLADNTNGYHLPQHPVDCPCCGLRQSVPALQPGEEAHCTRCNQHLVRIERNAINGPLAYATGSLMMLVVVALTQYIQIDLAGLHVTLTIPGMMRVLIAQDFGFLAEVMFMLTFGTPVLFTLLCLYVYGGLKAEQALPGMLYATRVMVRLRGWMMVDVFFISTLVAYIKIISYAQVIFGPAFYLTFILAILLIRTAQSVPEHWIYYEIQRLAGRNPTTLVPTAHTISCSSCLYEQPANRKICTVCGSLLYARRPLSLRVSMACLLAAIMLYIPANVLPMMITSNPLGTQANTIFSGIEYMWQSGDKVIAMIIFSASMAIPILKILAMLILIYSAGFRPLLSLPSLTRLYRFTESVGRWSMIDIFVVIILMAAFRTPLAKVAPGAASVYFCLVVLLTMLSALYFDPRLMWDKMRTSSSHPSSPTAGQS